MASFQICGGCCLDGEVSIQGSKNAALPILSACLLAPGVTKLYNCPRIADVYNMLKILENMGCRTSLGRECAVIDTSSAITGKISQEDSRAMRSSLTLLGALLGRLGRVSLPWPGGCSIGKRPVDLHLDALARMNISVKTTEAGLECQSAQIRGTHIKFPYPSVGATEYVILASVLAQGTTVIENAAKEPEVVDLCHFLNEMGASIHGMGTGCITVYPVKRLKNVSYRIMSDRIVAGTYLTAAAATGGNVTVAGVRERDIRSVLDVLADMGCGIIVRPSRVQVIAPQAMLAPDTIHTRPFPGFPTDMQSQMMVCLTAAMGDSEIREDIFEDRFKIVPQLKKMGAKIQIHKNKAFIQGRQTLCGADVEAQDLRGGAALVIAGLMAQGETQVAGTSFIERGYEDICKDLGQLGARISRI